MNSLTVDNANNGLMTKIWGPGAWMMLESCAFGYPIRPTQKDKDNFKIFYSSIANVLPCKYCRDSFVGFLEDEDTRLTDSVLESRSSLTKWIFRIHNKVNKKLDVDYGLTYDDFVNKYESFRAKCVKDANINGCNMPLKDKHLAYKMAYNKDFPLLDCDQVCLFMEYAAERELPEDEFYFHKFYKRMCDRNVNYQNDPNCDMWFKRNDECQTIVKNIQKGIYAAIEPTNSKWSGLPTIHELKLIARMTSSLSAEELERTIQNVKIHKKKVNSRERYYLSK